MFIPVAYKFPNHGLLDRFYKTQVWVFSSGLDLKSNQRAVGYSCNILVSIASMGIFCYTGHYCSSWGSQLGNIVVHVHLCVCMHMWRSQVDIRCHLQLLSTWIFETAQPCSLSAFLSQTLMETSFQDGLSKSSKRHRVGYVWCIEFEGEVWEHLVPQQPTLFTGQMRWPPVWSKHVRLEWSQEGSHKHAGASFWLLAPGFVWCSFIPPALTV